MKGDKVDLDLAVKYQMSSSIQDDIKQIVSAQLQETNFSCKIADIEKKLADHVVAQTDQLKQQELKSPLIVFGLPEDEIFENPEPMLLSLCQDKFPGINLLNSDFVFVQYIGK
jgi:disulfide oxidoreductase YuzD